MSLYTMIIVCCNHNYIGVWKSSFDNLEQLKFNLHLSVKRDWIDRICIHNGIIYGKESRAVRSWNIETGQII